jgi:para-aminobenzoate synthetase/4-amino-4-deoxychorismate lyase
MGLGSGIVADSEAAAEWRECLAKGAFVYDPARSFDLIETMRFDPHDGIADIERHLGRMKASADALGFAFDRHDARNELQAATFRLREPKKLRLLLSPTGALAIEVRPLPERPKIAWRGNCAQCLSPATISASATRQATAPFTTMPARGSRFRSRFRG